jgi:hypothetical protein
VEARQTTQKAAKMSTEDMNAPMDLSQIAELPQYGIGVSPPENNPTLWLTIGYGTAQMQFYLCDSTNYEEIARKLHKNIMDAGVAARRAKSGIVVAQGDVSNHVRPAQGRQQPRQGRKGT